MATTHPGNIGSVARAMKTMGIGSLYLVSPKIFPDEQAYVMASGAEDILEQAVVVSSLDDALIGCELVFGTSTRKRELAVPVVDPKQCADLIYNNSQRAEHIAILFGREHAGLTNQELMNCHYHISIPVVSNFSSLNLSHAVQVIAYEIYKKAIDHNQDDKPLRLNEDNQLAKSEDVDRLLKHLREVLVEIDFLKVSEPGRMMQRLQRLFNRARLETVEVNILRGILRNIQKKCSSNRGKGDYQDD